MPKRLELVSELAPQARVIALLVNPNLPTMEQLVIVDVQETVNAKGLQLHLLKAGTEGEIDAAFASLAELHRARRRPRSLLSPGRTVRGAGFTHAAPAVYEMRGSAAAGGLISYGTSLPGLIVRPAIYTGFSRVPGRTICLSSNRPHSSW